MTIRICVIDGKGGTGKTTVSTHLAAAFALTGLQTLLVDLDRHRGATRWFKLRDNREGLEHTTWKNDFGYVAPGVQRVVIDCPASLRAGKVRDIVAESDVIVVPLLPSVFDQHATRLFLRRLAEIKKVRKGRKRVLVVANRLRGKSAAIGALDAFVAELGHIAIARITDRSLYPALAAKGQSVFDAGSKASRAAQAEWMPLIEAIEDARAAA